MRILHILAGTGWGGAERVACTIHRLAQRHGQESKLELPGSAELCEAAARETGEEFVKRPEERNVLRWAHAARARAREYKPEVVHLHLATPGLFSVARWVAAGTPQVVTFHLLPRGARWPRDYVLPMNSERTARLWAERSLRLFVAVSAADGAALACRFADTAVRVVINAPALPPERRDVGPEIEWPDQSAKLLSVGRLHPQKGFARLLDALAADPVRRLAWHWVILGDGPERRSLAERARELGLESRITFAGSRVAEGPLTRADLVLCPSRFEGMPLVPMEAVLAGTPVVVSRIDPHRELLSQVPDSFFPEAESEWPERLVAWLAGSERLRALKQAQSGVFLEDPRKRFWREYLDIYREARSAPEP